MSSAELEELLRAQMGAAREKKARGQRRREQTRDEGTAEGVEGKGEVSTSRGVIPWYTKRVGEGDRRRERAASGASKGSGRDAKNIRGGVGVGVG